MVLVGLGIPKENYIGMMVQNGNNLLILLVVAAEEVVILHHLIRGLSQQRVMMRLETDLIIAPTQL